MKKLILIGCCLIFAAMAGADNKAQTFNMVLGDLGFSLQPPAQKAVDSQATVTLQADPIVDCGIEVTKQWQLNGADIPGANANALTFVASPANSGLYSLHVVMDGIVGDSSACNLVISSPSFKVTQNPWTQTKNAGDSTEFVIAFTGGTGPTWTVYWYKDGVLIPGAPNSTTFTIATVALTDAGKYSAIVVDSAAQNAASLEATLTVLPTGTRKPEWFIDHAPGSGNYQLSIDPHGASFASLVSDPNAVPEGCDFTQITAVYVFNRLYATPWTVLETHSWNGVVNDGESAAVTITGNGVDWGSNPTSFAINGAKFDVNCAVQTAVTGSQWIWFNVDDVDAWINSSVLTPVNSGMYVVDLSTP